MKNQYYRTCVVHDIDTFKDYEAIFHRFEKVSSIEVFFEDDGSQKSVVTSRVVGIVERTDGQIKVVDPECICFVDGFAERIASKFRTEEEYDD